MRGELSTLWIFAVVNFLYCDVLALMDRPVLEGYLQGRVNDVTVNHTFLLGAGVLMEISMAAIVISRLAPWRWNRWYNIVAGIVVTIVQIGTLTTPSSNYYWFFSIIEMATTVSIVWLAWNWRDNSASDIEELGTA